MSMHYWVAQHISDLFRNEPRNIGVFVRNEEQMAARFIGETENSQIDGRKLKGFSRPEVYRQWVEFWKDQIPRNRPEDLVKSSGSHYRVVSAGKVSDTDNDTPEMVVNYLYSLLVSEGGLKEALENEEDSLEDPAISLQDDLITTLMENELLESDDLFIHHPIRKNVKIPGKNLSHTPAFVQENGSLYVMEPIDFTQSRKKYSKDHAGLSAYMFRDIRDSISNVSSIAIVKVTEEDLEVEDVQYGMAVLENEADIVNWLDSKQKSQFIDSCIEVAA